MTARPTRRDRPRRKPAWLDTIDARAGDGRFTTTPDLLGGLDETKAVVKANAGAFQKGHQPGNKGKRYQKDTFTVAEIQAMIAAWPITLPDGKRFPQWRTSSRNAAIIAFFWETGVRIGELVALQPAHVDFDNHLVHVLRGKGDKRRVIGIGHDALLYLSPWLLTRHELGVPDDAPLFCHVLPPDTGAALGTSYVRAMVQRSARRAGITRRVHPHMFRATLAVVLDRAGVSLRLIQLQMGHASVATTQIYLATVNNREAADVVAAFDWRTGTRRRDKEPTR